MVYSCGGGLGVWRPGLVVAVGCVADNSAGFGTTAVVAGSIGAINAAIAPTAYDGISEENIF